MRLINIVDEEQIPIQGIVGGGSLLGGIEGPQGPQGPPGVAPKGVVNTYADLPTFPAPVNGDSYVVAADGKLYTYTTHWPSDGDGIPFRGPTGAPGPTGPKGDTGNTGISWKGAFSGSTNYSANDVVRYSGDTYICLVDHVASTDTPDVDATNWELFAAQGDTGPTGASGSGSGTVVGPSPTVDGEVALFSGTTGTVIKRATGSGLAKLTSGKLGTATSGTDYAPATTGSSVLKGNGSGGFSAAVAGVDFVGATTGSGVQKADGSGGLTAATAGTDFLDPATAATVTNKRIVRRVGSTTSSATPAINTDNYDQFNITALATPITSMSSGLSGTPNDGQPLLVRVKDAGTAQAISWGSSWRAIGIGLPTTTIVSKTLYVGAVYNSADSKWDVLAVGQEA